MVDRPKAVDDLTFRNVELHSLGRKEYGTLVLTRHHFVFRYVSGARRGVETGSQARPDAPKPRQKEMWMPYPIVHHCVLRPTHSFAPSARFDTGETHIEEDGDDDRLFPPTFGTSDYGRPSTDSAHLAPYSSPARSVSPGGPGPDGPALSETGRQPSIRIRLKDFRMLALHFHNASSGTPSEEIAREVFYGLRSRCCIDNIRDLHAFHFTPPKEETSVSGMAYDSRREYARMGIGVKVATGPGAAWRISDINKDYAYSATYPSVLCVPATVSDNLLKYGGVFRSRSRIPCLSYLHSNGGSITRSSQPMVGVQNKRNPQDERLVSAIFLSHASSTQPQPAQERSLDNATGLETESGDVGAGTSSLPIRQSDTAVDEISDEKHSQLQQKIYGSTRRNLIVDARPKINALANRATGGGIEDVAHYRGSTDAPVERIFLNVANIHVMRASLDKVIESFANSDYINMKPDQEALRKSGWLTHIAGMLDGAELIARVIGLGGSHVLLHCSDGWDRTAQISALVQVMLDPHARTLKGFISLVQKDFLSFGHKFRDRDGIEGSEKWFEIENERVAPSRNRDNNASDPNSLNSLGSKALSGAKNWFEKNRGAIFRQQNSSRDDVSEHSSSRPPSPPPNPFLHSPSNSSSKEERSYRMSEKEVSPIFHQFLETVFQLQHQYPNSFEFNEHFLVRLFYHAYSCQYGEFLFNNEKERKQHEGQVPSVWSHFLSRKQEFTNTDYDPQVNDPLLFPRRSGSEREVEVRWWNKLFRREDQEMNVLRALTRMESAGHTFDSRSSASFDERTTIREAVEPTTSTSDGALREIKNTATPSKPDQSLAAGVASLNITHREPDGATVAASSTNPEAAPFPTQEQVQQESIESNVQDMPAETAKQQQPVAVEYEGDPLGVTTSPPQKVERSGLDFAAFASQNAFRD